MTPERWNRIEEVFASAAELPSDARDAFLADACAGDDDLLSEVAALLASAERAPDRLRATVDGAAANFVDDELPTLVGRRIGPYRVLRVLGEGGMGTVYLAERDDAEYRRRVAIKVMVRAGASRDLVARFRDERQLLAALDHPGIVRLLDGGTTDEGMPYLVMEHVEGVPLVAHAGELPVRARIELILRVADALQYAHQQLIVHRDVKPSNILVDDRGTPKLLDFGIAKLLDDGSRGREAQTRTGMAMFTVEYASPEQARGEPISVATDVYSLGAVLYHLLVGAPPQRAGATLTETLERICEREPPRPSVAAPVLRRELAGDLDNIVAKALRKRAGDRYASISHLADDLRRWLDGLPVTARDATLAYRTRKFVARHRGKLAIAGLIAAALGAAVVVSIRQARRADNEAAQAEREKLALVEERAVQELSNGHARRALPYLAEALRAGDDGAAMRMLVAEAMRPLEREVARAHIPAGVTLAAWSPDGARIAVGEMGGIVELFDGDLRPVARLDTHSPSAGNVFFSPDGSVVAAGDARGRIHVWRSLDGAVLLEAVDPTPTTLEPDVYIALASGGARVAIARADARVEVRRIADGEVELSIPAEYNAPVAFSPDGRRFAAVSPDGTILVFPVGSTTPTARLSGHAGRVTNLFFSADSHTLYSGADDGTIRIADSDTGAVVAAWKADNASGSLDLSRDGTRLVDVGDQTVKVWDAHSGAFVVELVGIPAPRWARFDPSGARIVTSGGDYRIWNAVSGALQLQLEPPPGAGTAPGSKSGVNNAWFSPDGRRILAMSGVDVVLIDASSSPQVAHWSARKMLLSAAWSPDERFIAVGGAGVAEIWAAATGAKGADLSPPNQRVWEVGWSPDGNRIAFAGNDSTAEVHALDGRLLLKLGGHNGAIYRIAFSPDGTRIATAGADKTARVWDAETGVELLRLRHSDSVMAAAWSHDGRRIVTSSYDHHLRIWDASDGMLEQTIDGGDIQFLDTTFRPDGGALAATGHGAEAVIYDLSGARGPIRLVGHVGAVTAAVWSPDGGLLATASDDTTVRVWDPQTGRALAVRHPTGGCMSLVWNSQGTQVLTATDRGDVEVWDVHRDPRPLGDMLDSLLSAEGGALPLVNRTEEDGVR